VGFEPVEIAVTVNLRIRLFNLGISAALEVEMEVLGEIPTDAEITVPQELRGIGGREGIGSTKILKVTLLKLVVTARHVSIERHILRQPVETEAL
jgi:hypothetical protein